MNLFFLYSNLLKFLANIYLDSMLGCVTVVIDSGWDGGLVGGGGVMVVIVNGGGEGNNIGGIPHFCYPFKYINYILNNIFR